MKSAMKISKMSFSAMRCYLININSRLQTPDYSTFPLTANRPMNPQIPRGKSPMQPRFSPRQGPSFSAPRPYHHQFNCGPPQYNRSNSQGNSPFSKQQYPRGNSQTLGNSFSNRPYSNNSQQPTQGGNFSYDP